MFKKMKCAECGSEKLEFTLSNCLVCKDCNEIFTVGEEVKPNEISITNEELINAALYVIEINLASINKTQAKFSFGFNKTMMIFNKLEELGVLSAKKGTEPRDILVSKEQVKELINN